MTLFIACLLVYHFDMSWWWYGIAAAIYVVQGLALDWTLRELHRKLDFALAQLDRILFPRG